jgi:hypothetical protein
VFSPINRKLEAHQSTNSYFQAIILFIYFSPFSFIFFSINKNFEYLLSLFFIQYFMPLTKEDSGVTPSSSSANRRLSLPDLTKLKDEWDRREAIQATAQLSTGKLQVMYKSVIYIYMYILI